MPPAHLLWPFLLATVIFAAIPGPGILYTAAQTMARGQRIARIARGSILIGLGTHLAISRA